jgi:hypothetical protein
MIELVRLDRVLSSGSTMPVFINPAQVLFVQGNWRPGESTVYFAFDQTVTVKGYTSDVAYALSGDAVREPVLRT